MRSPFSCSAKFFIAVAGMFLTQQWPAALAQMILPDPARLVTWNASATGSLAPILIVQNAPGSSGEKLPASKLRSELDDRLKAALRRNYQQTYRLVSLELLLQRHGSQEKVKKAVAAYWTVVRLVVAADLLSEALSEMETLACPPERRPYLEAVKDAATSQLLETRSQLAAAQFELAAWAGVSEPNLQPFPDDIFHTGGYNTYLSSLFAGTVPREAQRIDILLPLVRQSMYLHFTAARSAHDAWLAYRDATNSGSPNVEAAATMWRLAVEENLRCLETIERYNRLILDYALLVRETGITSDRLLGMLLEEGSRHVVSHVTQASSRSDAVGETPRDKSTSTRAFDSPNQPLEGTWFHQSPRCEKQTWLVSYLRNGSLRESIQPEEADLSRGFFGSITATRLEDFVNDLSYYCSQEPLTCLDGKPVPLSDFLRANTASPEQRSLLTRQYWELVEAQSRFFALVKYSAYLGQLFPLVVTEAGRPGGAEAVLQLHATRNSVDAALQDAHISFIEKRLALGMADSRAVPAEVLASTPPFAGAYETRWNAIRAYVTPSRQIALGKLASEIPGIYAGMVQMASSLLSADLSRQRDVEAYLRGEGSLPTLLASIQLEFDLWLEFIRATYRYNVALADYVAGCLPLASDAEYLKAIGVK